MGHRAGLIGSLCGAVLACAGVPAAQAADQFDYTFTPSNPLIYDWSGAYAGVAVGGMWTDFDTIYEPAGRLGHRGRGVSVSGLGGVLAQVNNFVFGVELDLSLSSLDDTKVITGIPVTAEIDWTGSLRGRAGYAFDNVLIYGTAGLAMGRFSLSRPGLSASSTQFGWTVGAGIEMGITENFTARAEYLYSDLGSVSGTLAGSPFSTEFDSHSVRAGVIYRFR